MNLNDLEMIKNAITLEEKFLPEIHELLENQLFELRLSADNLDESRRLLNILLTESRSHFALLKEAYLQRGGSEND